MSDFKALDRTATSQHGLLTRSQLHAFGLTDRQIQHRVKSGQLGLHSQGVYSLPGTHFSWHQQVNAAVLAGGDLCAASHRTASHLWGMRSVDEDIEVSIRYPRDLKIPGAILHRSRDLIDTDITWVDGIATTTPDRTICDLGLTFPLSEVNRILRHAIATGLVNRRDLWTIRMRNSKQGRNGVGVLGYALESLPARAEYTESGIEVLFLALCGAFNLPVPAMQLPVMVDGRVFRLDFAFPAQKIFIEVDGASFHSTPTQIANDGGRQNALVRVGWTPLRFTYRQLVQEQAKIARIVHDLLDL